MNDDDEPRESIDRVVEMLHKTIAEQFGDKCEGFSNGCPCCEIWAYLELVESIRKSLQSTHMWTHKNPQGQVCQLTITAPTPPLDELYVSLAELRNWKNRKESA